MKICETCGSKPTMNNPINRLEFVRKEDDEKPGPLVHYVCSSCALQLDLFEGSNGTKRFDDHGFYRTGRHDPETGCE